MPPRFADALAKHKKANEAFGRLVPSRRKEILRYPGSLKTEVTLERNIAIVLQYLHGRKPKGLTAILRVK